MKKGCFIVFEGIEGSGKTTLTQELYLILKKKMDVKLTQEPTRNTPTGDLIQKILTKKKKVPQKTLALLFAADRLAHVENELLPWLNEGKVVICDRYLFSSLAYQGAMEIDLCWLLQINDYEVIPKPDLLFFIEIPVDIALNRIDKRPSKTLFDSFDFLNKVQKIYKEILIGEKFQIEKLDGTKSVDFLIEKITQITSEFIKRHNSDNLLTKKSSNSPEHNKT